MSHTEGKLKASGRFIDSEETQNGVAMMVRTGDQDPYKWCLQAEVDARRLVACWNALLPVETEWLEQYNTNPVIDSVFTENAKLRQERDELVKAATKMFDAVRDNASVPLELVLELKDVLDKEQS